MQAFSTADGFLNVKEGVDEMIKYLANEPSAGLFFVQQHARASMPHLLTVKESIVEKVHEVTLHTEDIEDSICAVRSMAEHGLPIVDEMIKDINNSLLIMPKSQPKRGLIQNPSWGFQVSRSNSSMLDFSDSSTDDAYQNERSGRNYLSAMFYSARQRAAGLRWPQPEQMARGRTSEKPLPSISPQPTAVDAGSTPTPLEVEGDELPLSSHLLDDQLQESTAVEERLYSHNISSMVENYDKFKTQQELKLQEWLQEPGDQEMPVSLLEERSQAADTMG